MTKKSQFLKDLQEYLRTGTRTLTKLEIWLVKAEDHIKKLEKSRRQAGNISSQSNY